MNGLSVSRRSWLWLLLVGVSVVSTSCRFAQAEGFPYYEILLVDLSLPVQVGATSMLPEKVDVEVRAAVHESSPQDDEIVVRLGDPEFDVASVDSVPPDDESNVSPISEDAPQPTTEVAQSQTPFDQSLVEASAPNTAVDVARLASDSDSIEVSEVPALETELAADESVLEALETEMVTEFPAVDESPGIEDDKITGSESTVASIDDSQETLLVERAAPVAESQSADDAPITAPETVERERDGRSSNAANLTLATHRAADSEPHALFDESCLTAENPAVVLPTNLPKFRVQVEGLLLHRSGGDRRGEILRSATNSRRTRFSEDFGDWGTGGRLAIFRDSHGGQWSWGADFLQTDGWSRRHTLTGLHSALGVNLGSGRTAARYQSDLSSLSIDARRYVSNWTQVVAGFRWMQLDETATVRGQGTFVLLLDRRERVQNSFLGGHLGIDHTVWDRGGKMTVDVNGRVGLLNNQIDRISQSTVRFESETTSVLGELVVDGQYRITRNAFLTFGYQLMAISDVGFALDQLTSGATVHDSGELFAHGFRAGLGLAW